MKADLESQLNALNTYITTLELDKDEATEAHDGCASRIAELESEKENAVGEHIGCEQETADVTEELNESQSKVNSL